MEFGLDVASCRMNHTRSPQPLQSRMPASSFQSQATPASSAQAVLPPYLLTTDATLQQFRVVPSRGLSAAEVARRQKKHGPNVLPDTAGKAWWRLFLDRFRDALVLLLLAAAGLALAFGEVADAAMIGIAILLDATLSFSQVWRTEKTLRNLRQHVELSTLVIRNGSTRRLPASYLVPGDIITFRAGEKIPADARILTANGLKMTESTLTGEVRDVTKVTWRLPSRTALAGRKNMLYLGTTVTNGSGTAVVTATATRTEFGRIALMLKRQVSPASPLRKKLQRQGIIITWVVIALVVVITALGLLQKNPISDTLRTAITLIVSAIPEDITVILTITLTVGMVRILRHKGVVRELSSAETLGATTVICADKTGTLTTGQMTADHFNTLDGPIIAIDTPPSDPLHTQALLALALANDAYRLNPTDPEYFGSATEKTALQFVESLGLSQASLRQQWHQEDIIPFSPEWKYRAGLYRHPTQASRTVFVMGAPELLLEKSNANLRHDGLLAKLDPPNRTALHEKILAHASQGERLVGVAIRRHYPRHDITHADITELCFLGVLVIRDQLRPEVPHAIAQTRTAGIKVKMITGDLPATALAIARSAGLSATLDTVVTGEAIEQMSDEELQQALHTTNIFARVSPLDKQRLIRLLQAQGEIVAMTGDGVNDAVALKSADIGVAMGSGKDIAKDAADLVLLDNNFATIVHAVREGRVIRDNLRKVIAFLLSTNVAEVAIFLVSALLHWPLPLLPAQILWINLVTDGTSDIALSLEPDERNIMHRSPESPTAPLMSRRLLYQILSSGFIMTTVAMVLYWYLWRHLALDLPYVQTMIFCFVAVSSLLSTWSFRSLHDSLYRRGLWQNPWIIISAGFSFLLQLAAIYIPLLQRFFGTVALTPPDWALIFALALATVIIIDLRKLVFPTHTTH